MKTILIAVISLDGRITPPGESGPGFASPEDQEWFARALHEFDCSVMGRTTFESIASMPGSPPESRRLRVVLSRDSARHSALSQPGRVEFSSAAPAAVISDLAGRGFHRCALLGGGQIYRQFLDAGLVDALWLTLEPVVLGGGTLLADGPLRDGRFELGETRILGPNTLLLNYRRPGQPLFAMPAL